MLTTVVGNYPKIPNRPRPARLRNAINRFDRGEITLEELHRIEDEVTVEVINEQVEAGLDLITDGQIRWEDDQTYFARRMSGFSTNGLIRYFDTNTYYRQPEVIGKVAWQGPISVRDFTFAVANSPRPVKACVTGPYTLARLSSDQHYGDLDKLVLDLAEALHNEVIALQDAGAGFIQVNEPAITKNAQDFPLISRALTSLMDGVTVETALYTWFGAIDGLYPQILNLPFDVIGLDFVMGWRNWQIIKSAAFTKKLGFGIIDARNTRMESEEYIIEKLKEISETVPLDRVHLNPSCGLEYLPREVAQAKLTRMVAAARRAVEVLA